MKRESSLHPIFLPNSFSSLSCILPENSFCYTFASEYLMSIVSFTLLVIFQQYTISGYIFSIKVSCTHVTLLKCSTWENLRITTSKIVYTFQTFFIPLKRKEKKLNWRFIKTFIFLTIFRSDFFFPIQKKKKRRKKKLSALREYGMQKLCVCTTILCSCNVFVCQFKRKELNF